MKLPDIMTADSIAEALGRGHKCATVLCGSCFAAFCTLGFRLLKPHDHVNLRTSSSRSAAHSKLRLKQQSMPSRQACMLVRTEYGQLKQSGLYCRAHTISVKSQGAGPQMELGEWAAYHAKPPPQRRKLYNIVSLSLANTPLEVRPGPFDNPKACDCPTTDSNHSCCTYCDSALWQRGSHPR